MLKLQHTNTKYTLVSSLITNGIFVTKRNIDSFSETAEYIIKNYISIQKEMEKNMLPTKKKFIEQISNIIEKN